MTHAEGLGTIGLGQGALASLCSDDSEDASPQSRMSCHPPHTIILFPRLSAYLIEVFLDCCGIGQKLVVYSGLLHCSLHIVAKPQVVDDGLEGEDSRDVSTAL